MLSRLISPTPRNASVEFLGDLNPYGLRFVLGKLGDNLQRQFNVTDNLSRTIGAHRLKFGLDYRRLSPDAGLVPYLQQDVFTSLTNLLVNQMAEAFVLSRTADVDLIFSNWSLFAQDTWKAARTLTVTYGLRWEYDAAPSSPNGTLPLTVTGVDNLATATLAPPGTPLWHPQKDDFAPRLGLAWQPLPNLVVRAGAGIFYDLGYSGRSQNGAGAFPYLQTKSIFSTSFPLTAAQATPLPFTTSPPAGYMVVVDPNHVLPRTYEWNAAVERTLGRSDILTVTYLGAAGRKLMRTDNYAAPNLNFTGEFELMRNDADSSYNARQVQFRHRLSRGLQTLLSYSWAHSIDDASYDTNALNVPPGDSAFSDRAARPITTSGLHSPFKIHERLALQARGDLFNIFNHPDFGSPINYLSSPQFGQSTQMLGASLGGGGQSGGLNPLYQFGGPRSAQLALNLLF